MMQRVLSGLIIVSTLTLTYLFGVSNAYVLAGFTFMLGLLWWVMARTDRSSFGTAFFCGFVVLTVLCALLETSKVLVLLGFSTALTAWDLARFRDRIKRADQNNTRAVLEIAHLQKLFIAVGSGFLIALVPVFLQLSVSFVGVSLLLLITLVILRQSLLYLRTNN